jgi:hypothetical protein
VRPRRTMRTAPPRRRGESATGTGGGYIDKISPPGSHLRYPPGRTRVRPASPRGTAGAWHASQCAAGGAAG